jgi:hypothetical protein
MNDFNSDVEYIYLSDIYGEKVVITELRKWIVEAKDIDVNLKAFCKEKLDKWYKEIKEINGEKL